MKRAALALLVAACLVFNAAAQGKEDREDSLEMVEGLVEARNEGLLVDRVKMPRNCAGNRALPGQRIAITYLGKFDNGEVFVDSAVRGGPMTLVLGKGEVMPGLDRGLAGMCVGEKRKIVIPPALAYGKKGQRGFIPGDATLIMEVELVGINVPEDRDD